MTGLSDYQRGYMDALSPADTLEDAVVAFVRAELARRDPEQSDFAAHHACLNRWRDVQTRLQQRALEQFEADNAQPAARPRLTVGRTYPLPEDADDGERREHELAEAIGMERAA